MPIITFFHFCVINVCLFSRSIPPTTTMIFRCSPSKISLACNAVDFLYLQTISAHGLCDCVLVAQLCLTFNDLMDYSLPGPSAPRQEPWSGQSFPSPGDLPDQGIKPWSPALQEESSPSEPAREARCNLISLLSSLLAYSPTLSVLKYFKYWRGLCLSLALFSF